MHDLFLHSQAVAPLNPGVKSSVGAYRRAIGDALGAKVHRFRRRILQQRFKYQTHQQYAAVAGRHMFSALMINMVMCWQLHEWTQGPKYSSSWQD